MAKRERLKPEFQGAMGTNWSRGSSSWTRGRTSSLWGWRSPGPGCPGRLGSLLLWRYSRPAWTRSSTAYCRWPCFGRRVGIDDPQRSLPTPTILWFTSPGAIAAPAAEARGERREPGCPSSPSNSLHVRRAAKLWCKPCWPSANLKCLPRTVSAPGERHIPGKFYVAGNARNIATLREEKVKTRAVTEGCYIAERCYSNYLLNGARS